jgi:ribosomal protein S18 acetylase RimI-like enzyme
MVVPACGSPPAGTGSALKYHLSTVDVRLNESEAANVLDNPVWAALTGPLAHFAQRHGKAVRFAPEMSPFGGLADHTDPASWDDLARLLGPGEEVGLLMIPAQPPPGWEVVTRYDIVQLVGEKAEGSPDPVGDPLGEADIPEILELVERNQPGPFAPRTIDFGRYIGVREGGALIAMCGERMRPPGWTEVSAVCTDPAYRGRGLATRLTRAVIHGIRERGERPFLHALATNTAAINLYERMGFTRRARLSFPVVRRRR